MAMSKTLYTGRRELTMAEYEELETIDINKDYNITDYPNVGITNEQMTFALTCTRLFPENSTFTCIDDGTYGLGKTYKIKVTDGVKSWEEVQTGGNPVKRSDSLTTPQQIMNVLKDLYAQKKVIVGIEYNKWSPSTVKLNYININIDTSVITCSTYNTTAGAGLYFFNYIGKSTDEQDFMFAGNINNHRTELRIYNNFIPCKMIRTYKTASTISYGVAEPYMDSGFTAKVVYI